MKIDQHIADKLKFRFLPAYAQFLLDEKLDDFVKRGLQYSREEDLPVLKYLASYSEEQLTVMGKAGNTELLSSIAGNNIIAYIEKSLESWVSNRLVIIDKDAIAAADITVGAFVRRKLFRSFLTEYAKGDASLFRDLMEEVDIFTTQNELLSYNAYINLQQEKLSSINEALSLRESQLLEAQEIAEMGSFLWHMTDPSKSSYTKQVMKIFEMTEVGNLPSFVENVHPDDRLLLQSAIESSLKNGGLYECEYRYIKSVEKKIWSRGIVSIENGKPILMKGTVMDVTKEFHRNQELTELNNSLADKNHELERINKELESFNYIASHDLQEPLRKIQTFSGRLSEHAEVLPKVTLGYIEKINSSSLRMQNLIEDLLAFSQITSPSEAFEHIDLNIVMDEAKNALSNSIEKSKALIHAEKLPQITAVPFQLSQLFINIIGNAIKYKKEDSVPQIHISSRIVDSNELDLKKAQGHYLQLSFRDNGIGFEPEYTEKIFDLFKRLHAREKYSGTGIGLSICKKIVHNHNGFIKAESEAGKGSTFHIYLPVGHPNRLN